MKILKMIRQKYLLFGILNLVLFTTYSQFDSSGGKTTTYDRVGIGTPQPANALHIKGTGELSTIRIEETGVNKPAFWLENTNQEYVLLIDNPNNYFRIKNGSGYNLLSITPQGNTGIGIDPIGKVDVAGLTYLRGAQTHSVLSEQLRFGREDLNIRYHSIFSFHGGSGSTNYLQFRIHTGSSANTSEQINAMVINGFGNVGIGVEDPVDAKLAVNGDILSTEVRVESIAGGPDYVFEEDYDLSTLEEVEAYIKDNKHLPEVPSAKEMEENGIELAQMNMLLLKKIEELTLHVIELKKQNDQLREDVEEIKKNN